jgi:hypothetical protein
MLPWFFAVAVYNFIVTRQFLPFTWIWQKTIPALNPAEAGQAPGNYTYPQPLAASCKSTHYILNLIENFEKF